MNPKLIPLLFYYAGLVAPGRHSIHAALKDQPVRHRSRRPRNGDFHKALRAACVANLTSKSVPAKLTGVELKEAMRRQKAARAFFNQAMKRQGKAA